MILDCLLRFSAHLHKATIPLDGQLHSYCGCCSC